jgi:hypothetical protein
MSKKAARRGRDSEPSENAVGRPLITLDDLDPNWEAIMTLLYQEGASDVEVRVALAIPPSRALSHETWSRLQDAYPEFLEAVNSGRALSEAWWMMQARQNVVSYDGVKFNNTLWIVNMRHRFGFKGADRNAAPGDDKTEGVQFYLPDNGRQKQSS